jgi:mono/diheme cytochrome c family protein
MRTLIFTLFILQFSAHAADLKTIRENILTPKCVGCHNSDNAAKGIDLSNDEGIIQNVIPYDSANSILYQAIVSTEANKMPLMQPALSKKEIRDIKMWIDEGAHAE